MTVYCGMIFDNCGFRSKETISIGVCLEYGVIGSENGAVVLAGERN